jgi:hypothetical protein
VGFFLAIATFKSFAGFSFDKTTGLWIIYILYPLICVVVYVISQLILVLRTLDDRWPLGDILFGVGFFAVGQVVMFAFSVTICDAVKHYIDGLFFFTLCMLLSVMMVYKYWDSITKEDLEFSVGSKAAVWEVKDPMLNGGNGSGGGMDYSEEESTYHGGGPGSIVGGMTGTTMYGHGVSHGYPTQGYAEREQRY